MNKKIFFSSIKKLKYESWKSHGFLFCKIKAFKSHGKLYFIEKSLNNYKH
jgi:hypothetical protein